MSSLSMYSDISVYSLHNKISIHLRKHKQNFDTKIDSWYMMIKIILNVSKYFLSEYYKHGIVIDVRYMYTDY